MIVTLTLSGLSACADVGGEEEEPGSEDEVSLSEEELGLHGWRPKRHSKWWWWHRFYNAKKDAGRDAAVDSGSPVVDSGSPEVDSSVPEVDSGTPEVDSGTPEVDSGTPEVDSGTPEVDSGTPEVDSGTPEVDSGTPEVDSGTPEVDSGTPEVDSGTPEVDSGTPVVDSGVTPPTARFGTEACDTCLETQCNPYFGVVPYLADCADETCDDVFACFQSNDCATDTTNVTNCYCGNVPFETCQMDTYTPVGPCRQLVETGLGTTVRREIFERWLDPSTSAGDGIGLFNCAAELCQSECLVNVP